MALIHRQQIAEPAAIFPALVLARQLGAARPAFFRRFLLLRVCFPVFLPPFDPAPVATKPPPPSCTSFPLLHYVATFRTDVYLSFIIPFCVVISVPTLIAAVMARWDKAFSTIQAFQFFSHTFTPLSPILHHGGEVLYYLTLT